MVTNVMSSLKEVLSLMNQQSSATNTQTKNLLSTIINTNPYGIILLDHLGNITLINKNAEDLLGVNSTKALHQPIWNQTKDRAQQMAIQNIVENILINKPKPVPYFGYITNLKKQQLHLRVDWDYLTADTDKTQGIIAIVQDIGKDHLPNRFTSPSIIEQVQYSRLASIEEVVARITHELNQPLSAILNFSHGALRQLETSDTKEDIVSAVQMISKQAKRAGDVLLRMSNFIQKGELRKEYLNINEIIKEVLECMHQEIRHNKIHLVLDFNNFLPAVLADKVQIEQVFLNIIQNAIEAMSLNKIEDRILSIATLINNDKELVIEIKDNGHGMSQQVIDNIFDAFYSTKEAGMGIGLAISQSIIHAHLGKLLVTSHEKQGATFCIVLPT